MKGIFVTGTDTGVGKTRVAVALIHALRAQGLRVAAMKPVSAGSAPGELNEDVMALRQAANVMADVRDVNPYAFEPAIAPHIAAEQAGVRIDLEMIAAAYARPCARSAWISARARAYANTIVTAVDPSSALLQFRDGTGMFLPITLALLADCQQVALHVVRGQHRATLDRRGRTGAPPCGGPVRF